ncbi:RIP metalloprotease RseP [Comamonas sp. UBA7528]|uniref:RIP metalloprotease RseP n=1 Tax=Comamonas sp. UBA7528 TaxID=1946391 RepID=UPI0025C2D42E|nr:RIP metalloprotease RseP [Comamonas sp. UBA7528]
MLTVLAFVVALGILIAVHEYGHYRMAVACGVKVLRFSVGFGKPLLRWQSKKSSTEFVLGALPLGGYVRMLDEREAPVDSDERHLAFNRQPLRSRVAIVAAGPAANLLLAVLLYALVNWVGLEEPRAVLAAPATGSVVAQAGLRGGERVTAVQVGQEAAQDVRSFEHLRWALTQAALEKQDARITWQRALGEGVQTTELPLSTLPGTALDASLGAAIGVQVPWTPAQVERVMDAGAAAAAGLQPGDVVTQAFGVPVMDGFQLRQLIRQHPEQASDWTVVRSGQPMQLSVKPEAAQEQDVRIGRVGAYIGGAPEMVIVRLGAVEGLWAGVTKTWDVSVLSLKMMGRMLIGEASLKNLSGPLTIADYAGKSASMGWVQYLAFLALISVSLGVLNLLPLPVLDGGHLMYYLWEGVTGRAISELWMERLQRAGVSVLLVMMCIAFFNDISRILG